MCVKRMQSQSNLCDSPRFRSIKQHREDIGLIQPDLCGNQDMQLPNMPKNTEAQKQQNDSTLARQVNITSIINSHGKVTAISCTFYNSHNAYCNNQPSRLGIGDEFCRRLITQNRTIICDAKQLDFNISDYIINYFPHKGWHKRTRVFSHILCTYMH